MTQDSPQHGFGIIHSNQLEVLADALIDWTRNHPLAPLKKETILVQANGMADWLKVRMVEQTGIAASYHFPLPATFLWQLYSDVLGPESRIEASPFAKASLEWRLYRLLPQLIDGQPAIFNRPAAFLYNRDKTIDETRHYQLAHRLADLYDQYQLYRGDWLNQWAKGTSLSPKQNPVWTQDEAWQRTLWQALLADIEASNDTPLPPSRAELHQQFIARLKEASEKGQSLSGLPKRLFLFGINSLPAQLLNALYYLSAHCQVFLFILNPCKGFWEVRDDGMNASQWLMDDTPLNNTLLDSWGSRGRDFMRLLAEQEVRQPEVFRQHLKDIRAFVDHEETENSQTTLPLAIQQDILTNSQPGLPQPLPPLADCGLTFLPAYSRQREVEVLHDKLLALFNDDNDTPPNYRDIIVMVPNIDDYAAHIHAVFRREPSFLARSAPNPRRLDYRISDTNPLTDAPLYAALDYLLHLPDARFTQSELLGLLELDAVQRAFGIGPNDLEQITRWLQQGHIRWGLDARQKAQLLNQPADDTWRNNTWQQGMDRLLAGYCAGDAAVWGHDSNAMMDGLAIDEVSGNQGELLGNLQNLLDALHEYRKKLSVKRPPSGDKEINNNDANASWEHVFNTLLTRFFAPYDEPEQAIADKLQSALGQWLNACDQAQFNDALPLATARSGWLSQVEQAGMSGKLYFSGVTFCTLMPMRALPFKHIFLLGMNDRDYPRQQTLPDFDLMDTDYRPGDRDRRGDDQYLFLEALLSVRQSLTISWVGKSIHDRSDKQPSTLISQLRDYIDARWETKAVDVNGKPLTASQCLTQNYPLTPFSRRYFEETPSQENQPPNLRTYANEWRQLHVPPKAAQPAPLASIQLPETLALQDLIKLLKNPVKVFYQKRLGVYFRDADVASEDDEPFSLDNLQQWQLRQYILDASLANTTAASIEAQVLFDGSLPAGGFAKDWLENSQHEVHRIIKRAFDGLGDDGHFLPPEPISCELEIDNQPITLNATLSQRWRTTSGTTQLFTSASKIKDKGWRYDKLADAWVYHLATCANYHAMPTRAVGLEGTTTFAALTREEARQQLQSLVSAYHDALQAPAAFSPKAAAAYLNAPLKDDANEAQVRQTQARQSFNSGYNTFGDDTDTYITQAFTDFETVWGADGSEFIHWVNRLYKPIKTAIEEGQA